MRATFLNNLYEAKLLAAKGTMDDDDIVIPVGPDARYYAEKKGWPIRLIGDFISEKENRDGREKCEKIVNNVATAINRFYDLKPQFVPMHAGEYFLFDLYVLLGQVLFTNQLIESVSNEHSIRVFENKHLANKLILGIRPHPDYLMAEIIRRSGKENSNIVSYSDRSIWGQLTFKRRLRYIMPEWAIDGIYKLKWYKEKIKNPALWLNSKKKVLVLGGMFDWLPVVFSAPFTTKYLPTFRSKSDYPKKTCSTRTVRTLSALISEAVFPSNPDTFDFNRLARYIHSTAEYLSEKAGKLEWFVRQYDVVLASAFVTPLQQVIAHYAIRNGKPVICYQHGEMNLYPTIFSGGITEVVNSTHYFAYGKGVTPKYEQFIGKTHLKEVISVGSTRKKNNYNKGNFVVYATGKWFKAARLYLHNSDPDARLYEAQRELIAFLEKYSTRNPRDRVILKANNSDYYNSIPFHTTIDIDYTSKFTELLQNAKLVILDAPATTCIESASTSVPLFILSGRSPWYDAPINLLKRRAVVEDRVDRLIVALEQFEKTGVYPANMNDREFSDAYAGVGDGRMALKKAMENLDRIVNQSIKE